MPHEKLSEQYNLLYATATKREILTRGWPQNRLEALTFFARPGGRLLEIGCGDGEVLFNLSRHFDSIYGTELSEIRIARAQQLLNRHPDYHISHETLEEFVERLGGSLTFDCILWADVVEHVVDPLLAFRNIANLCTRGTQLITSTPNIAFFPHRLRLLLGKFPSTSLPIHADEGFTRSSKTILLDGGHLHYFTYNMLIRLYRLNGFNNIRCYGLGQRFSRLRNLCPRLLSGNALVVGYYGG